MPHKNPDDARAWAKLYYQRNREKKDAQSLAWRLANPDRHQESCRAWKQRNPDRIRASGRKTSSTRRARIASVFVEEIDPRIVYERDGGVCQICGGSIDGVEWHVDHIQPIARGGLHEYKNVQLAHKSCNLRKWAKV